MEEILASIRRIIEDSDTGRNKPEDMAGITQDIEPQEAPAIADVDAFRAEFRTEPKISRPVDLAETQSSVALAERGRIVPSTEQPAPVTLAEVGAQLHAQKTTGMASNGAPSPSRTPDVADRREEVVASTIHNTIAAGQPWDEPTDSVSPVHVEAASPVIRTDAAENVTSELPEAEPVRPVADVPASRLAIVSEQTGRQVAAAFGELSEAFASRSKKTFDDKAEEMLKPMLQDWLDNNLPTLVERLVREEIERVARGA
ncbi:PopZ family protein [Mesorhizobium sp. Root157]|uniref:PopZ family protein n=1 Tax=Mesorhizobium sp. Root157 TaxID=1736477 RepID=UPI001FCD17DA|nr:PopZ family protein [Mesorhizobium sp. Root157]